MLIVTQRQQSDPTMPTGAEAQIAQKLRSFYLSVENEPIPKQFLDLLEKLDGAEKLSELQMEDRDR
ncbi:NepR family anti-sigma factor [Mycoplana ramosa]|uniref:NepR family anti-sigma factor n=1 Tax=Mycoplana ramosa TaxID=40837 RepID=A0ABW3YYU5_MYCRA